MPRRTGSDGEGRTEEPEARGDDIAPRGSPDWVTAELIADTISTWQPYYQIHLTQEQAIEILLSVGSFLDLAVLEGENGEAVSGPCESLVS